MQLLAKHAHSYFGDVVRLRGDIGDVGQHRANGRRATVRRRHQQRRRGCDGRHLRRSDERARRDGAAHLAGVNSCRDWYRDVLAAGEREGATAYFVPLGEPRYADVRAIARTS